MDNDRLPSFQGSETLVYQRVEQCLDRLRVAFRCWSDIVPILQEIVDDGPHTHVVKYDFGTLHRCRNFDMIRNWTIDNGVKKVHLNDGWWGGAG